MAQGLNFAENKTSFGSGLKGNIMEKTKNQHYVPRMYIKRFGYGTEDNPRISVLKKAEGIPLHNQNPENFASKRFFYDTTEDVIADVLKEI